MSSYAGAGLMPPFLSAAVLEQAADVFLDTTPPSAR